MRLLIFPFPIADVCLMPASRGGDVGQAPVPSLDAQIAESRRGFARRVAGSPFSSSLCRGFFPLLLCGLSFDSRHEKIAKKNYAKKKPNNISKTTPRKNPQFLLLIDRQGLDCQCVRDGCHRRRVHALAEGMIPRLGASFPSASQVWSKYGLFPYRCVLNILWLPRDHRFSSHHFLRLFAAIGTVSYSF
jgi:hypothetical protein